MLFHVSAFNMQLMLRH